MDAERAGWASRDGFVDRIGALLGAGTVSPPYWRGPRHFLSRREPGQQFSVLYVVDADGTERALIDPIALDPTGLTTLDSWQPSKEGDRLAYQLSIGGNEESLLYVMDVATGEVLEGPIDRCRYSPIAWVPGANSFYYVRRIAPELLPESERNFHRRVYLHRVGSPTESDILVFGAGMTMTNYYGVEVSRDGHWLQVSSSEGTEPRNNLWVADLTASPHASPSFTLVQGDVDAQTSLSFGRDGRVYVSTDLDAPRGPSRGDDARRLVLGRVGRPHSRGPRLGPRVGHDSRRYRTRRRPPRRRPHVAWCCPHVPSPGVRRFLHRGDPAARRRHDRRTGRAHRRRPPDLVRLHRPHHDPDDLRLRRPYPRGHAPRCSAGLGPGPDCRLAAGRVHLRRRHDRAHVRHLANADSRHAAADDPLRLRRLRRAAGAGLLGRDPRVGRGRRRLGDRQPARRQRGRRGVAS